MNFGSPAYIGHDVYSCLFRRWLRGPRQTPDLNAQTQLGPLIDREKISFEQFNKKKSHIKGMVRL